MSLPRIYLFLAADIFNAPRGVAMAEDGVILFDHLYPSPEIAIKALSGNLRQYRAHYPDGYQLVTPTPDDPGFIEAQRLNAELWEVGRPAREAEHAAQMEAKRFRQRD